MASYVTIDIETTGLMRYRDNINAVGILLQPEGKYLIARGDEVERIRKWFDKLRAEKRVTIFQNGNFDALFMEVKYGLVAPVRHDVMLMGTAYDLAAEHALDKMAWNYLGVPSWDISTKAKGQWTDEMKDYLKKDLRYTWELFQYFQERLDETQWRVYRNLLKPAYDMYRKTERTGIYLDRKKLQKVTAEYAAKEKAAKAKLDARHPGVNWNSPKQIQEVMYERECLPVRKYSKKSGEPSADAKSMKRLVAKGYELPQLLLDYKFYYGARTKFLTRWEQDSKQDSRIHPHFKLTNVVTGRTSCSDPNLQQVPRNKDLRTLFTAAPGRVLIEADYSQIELRVAAHYANDPVMMRIYREGGDIHTETARQVTGKKEVTKEDRTKAKAVNFGFIYGMGARGFMDYAMDNYGVVFTKYEAERYRELFFMKYPRLLDWHKEMAELCAALGGVDNLFGQFRKIPDIYSTDNYKRSSAQRIAVNTPVQGTANGILLVAAPEIARKLPVLVVGTIHDAILMDAPADEAEDLVPEIKRIMARPEMLDVFGIKLKVPIEADVGIGPWGSK